MLKKINKCLFLFLLILVSNIAFAKGAVELYTDAHSEEWIREAILSHPNVKEIAKMTKLPDSSQHRIYLVMKDETKIILSGVRIFGDHSIICFLSRLGDYREPKMLVYSKDLEKYYCENVSGGYNNEKFQEYINSRDLNLVLNNYKEFEAFFASMPCLTNEDLNLLKEGRWGEIEALKCIDWKNLREKEYANDYVVFKADDVSWGQWKVE